MGRKKEKDGELIQVAVALTECDIKKFNQYIILMNNPMISPIVKHEMALFIKEIYGVLKSLKNMVSERDFNIFYNLCFNNQSRRIAAIQVGIDETSISRIKGKVLKQFSAILYPDLHIYQIQGGE